MSVGEIRPKDLPATGSISETDDLVMFDGPAGTKRRTLQETRAALIGAPPVVESGTTRTLTAADNGRLINCTNSNGCAITVPSSLPKGFHCSAIVGHVTGHVTWAASGFGFSLANVASHLTASIEYAVSTVDVVSSSLGIVSGAVDS